MRIMGIDYGDARMGIAISDPFGWTARGIATILMKEGPELLFNRISDLIGQYSVNKIIVGFPRNMNGTIGPRGEKTLEFIDQLKGKTEVEVIAWDERLTTVAANKVLNETGMKGMKKKQVIDKLAAEYILQGYLDSIR